MMPSAESTKIPYSGNVQDDHFLYMTSPWEGLLELLL
jgi:hypothetical protein